MFLLDTNAWIADLRSGGRSNLSRRIRATPRAQIATRSVVRAELVVGAIRGPNPVRELAEINVVLSRLHSFSFDDAAADEYARIRADLERRGLPINGNDYFIVAIAVVNGLILVTHNTRDFSRVPGLPIEDWQ